MNKTWKILIIFILLAALAIPVTARASGLPDQFVIGQDITLKSGESTDGNLIVMGGNVVIEDGATVTGNLAVFGGNTQIDGTINGDLSSFGSSVILGDTAVVDGDVNIAGGNLNRAAGADIGGQVNENQQNWPYRFFPRPGAPGFDLGTNPFWQAISFLFQSFLLAALAALVAMFLPRPTERIARSAITQPLVTGAVGLLTTIIFPIVMIILVITILGIPIAVLLAIAVALALIYGWISIGLEVGNRMEYLIHQDFAPPVSAGVGTLVLTLVAGGIGQIVPCVGWILPFAISMLGLGAVLLTRGGAQFYPPPPAMIITPSVTVPPVAPVQPAPPFDVANPVPPVPPEEPPFVAPDVPQEPPQPVE